MKYLLYSHKIFVCPLLLIVWLEIHLTVLKIYNGRWYLKSWKKNDSMTLEEKMIAKGGIKLLFVKLIKKKPEQF